jgi:prophage regulatory protein
MGNKDRPAKSRRRGARSRETSALHRLLVERSESSQLRNSNQVSAVLPSEGLVRLSTVLRVFPVGESSWWRGIADGKYPAPVRIGARSVAWRASDIRKLIESAPLARLRQSRTTRPSPETAPVQQVS